MQSLHDVSVIICAYTEARWEDLMAAIESIHHQTQPAREIIVVVDHNPKLFDRVRRARPEIVVVENREPRGLSGARNTGIAVAQANVIAFLDDDAEAALDWLQHLTLWYSRDDVVGVGGIVEPRWEGVEPAWFPKEFHWVVGCSYQGLPESSGPVRNLFGGCMCIRRKAFDLVGGFRGSIGRSNGRPMGCEETEFCIRVHQHRPEWRFMFEPRAWAYHRVPAQRTTWGYFRARCYAEGLSKAQVSFLVGVGDGLSSERTYTMRALPRGVVRGLADGVLRRDRGGLLRAGAIIAGLGFTVMGYIMGVISKPFAKREKGLESV
jgi:glucosyl-dolichyl phosphate glucuronosyltransferase